MIANETVFVLGAGASAVFDYPIGRPLLDAVCNGLARVDLSVRNTVKNTTAFADREIDTFREALGHSGQSSVDAFLEHQPRFIDIGKAAMAAALVPWENPEELWTRFNQNWMLY